MNEEFFELLHLLIEALEPEQREQYLKLLYNWYHLSDFLIHNTIFELVEKNNL